MEKKNHVDRFNATANRDITKPFSCTECDLKFADKGKSISHKDIHNKKKISDTNNINKSNKNTKVSELTDNGENSDKSKKEKKFQTTKVEEHKGKSGRWNE